MPSKRVQKIFDKVEGLQSSFSEFEAEFPDEAAATAFALGWVVRIRQIVCSICGTVNLPKEILDRNFPCLKCKNPFGSRPELCLITLHSFFARGLLLFGFGKEA